MRLGQILRDNRRSKEESIKVFSAEYFELTYIKFGSLLKLVFMAPDVKKARIKAKSILHTVNGSKIVDIRLLDSKNLGPSISWVKNGEVYARFQKRQRKLRVRIKK